MIRRKVTSNSIIRQNLGGLVLGRIKNWLLRVIFKKEMEDYCSDLQKRLDVYIRKKDIECEKKTEMYDLMIRALEEKRVIVGIDKNKADEDVIVTRDGFDFNLYSHSYKAINRHPRIMTTVSRDLQMNTLVVKIEDILVEDNDRGNGSILMRYFLEYCKRHRPVIISGYLSSCDKDHFDRSEHFYKKHGFTVTFNENRTSGHIELKF